MIASFESKQLLLEVIKEKAITITELCAVQSCGDVMKTVKRIETLYTASHNEMKIKLEIVEQRANRWKEFDEDIKEMSEKLKDFEVSLNVELTESNNLEDLSRTLVEIQVIL